VWAGVVFWKVSFAAPRQGPTPGLKKKKHRVTGGRASFVTVIFFRGPHRRGGLRKLGPFENQPLRKVAFCCLPGLFRAVFPLNRDRSRGARVNRQGPVWGARGEVCAFSRYLFLIFDTPGFRTLEGGLRQTVRPFWGNNLAKTEK